MQNSWKPGVNEQQIKINHTYLCSSQMSNKYNQKTKGASYFSYYLIDHPLSEKTINTIKVEIVL